MADGIDEDFADNLFSDLAPLLALFGEQVAKQFLSHSTSWLDSLIFACAPIGILTAVTSAIRVGGNPWLKSLIGRASEAEAAAELELMSSTSPDVCELWNGVGVVRVIGTPSILELIYRPRSERHRSSEVYTLKKAYEEKVFALVSDPSSIRDKSLLRHQDGNTHDDESPPNIFLNVYTSPGNRLELILVAIIAIGLQGGVLVYDAVIVHHPNWNFGEIASHAFPATVVGTVSVVLGMFICAHIVEASTYETVWRECVTVQDAGTEIVWLQKGKLVGDQAFSSFAIYSPPKNRAIRTSRKAPGIRSLHTLTIVGAMISVCGFLFQFVGLRAMHWSAAIAQLIAIGTMAMLRIYIRRNISRQPKVIQLSEGYELDWMALQITNCYCWSILIGPSNLSDPPPALESDAREPETIHNGPLAEAVASQVLQSRVKLIELSGWRAESSNVADRLSMTMQSILNQLFDGGADTTLTGCDSLGDSFHWTIPIVLREKQQSANSTASFPLHLKRTLVESAWTSWQVDKREVEACVSLWMYHLSLTGAPTVGPNFWLLAPYNPVNKIIYDWWIRRGVNTNVVRLPKQKLRQVRDPYSHSSIPEQDFFDIPYRGNTETYQVHRSRILMLDHDSAALGASVTDYLGVVANSTLQDMCCQYLLGIFLSRVVEVIGSLKGKTYVVQGAGEGSFTLVNESIRKIAGIIEGHGFATSEDSYRLVVIPLSKANKLPDPFEDSEVLRSILSLKVADGQHGQHDQLMEFCRAKAASLCAMDRLRETRAVFTTLLDLSSELLGTNHEFNESVHELMRMFISNFVTKRCKPREPSKPPDEDLHFPVHAGAIRGDLRLVHDSLKIGRQVDAWDINSHTPLSLAAEHEELDVVRLLILYGAPIDIEVIEEIGARNMDLGLVGRLLLLNWEAATSLHEAAKGNHESVVRWLGAKGQDMSQKDEDGWTALHLVCQAGHLNIAKLLLNPDYNVNVDVDGLDGQTALHLSTRYGHQAITRLLVEYGADVKIRDRKGRTALHWPAKNGIFDMVQLLAVHGADLTAHEITESKAALHLAAEGGYDEIVSYLTEHGARLDSLDNNGRTPLHIAVNHGHTSAANILVEKGAVLMQKDIWGRAPLDIAAERGNIEMIKLLLEKGANAESRDDSGRGAYEYAAAGGQTEIVGLLIENGINLDVKDAFGRMALHYATMGGFLSTAQLIVEKSPESIDKQDGDGWTPLHYACNNKHTDVIYMLRRAGADESLVDRLGHTAEEYEQREQEKAVDWKRGLPADQT